MNFVILKRSAWPQVHFTFDRFYGELTVPIARWILRWTWDGPLTITVKSWNLPQYKLPTKGNLE